jgi:hypothetical protein
MFKSKLPVLFATSMREIDTNQMPKNGVILVPANPEGSWNAVCSDKSIADAFVKHPNAYELPQWGGYYTCRFTTGATHTKKMLEKALEKAGYTPDFKNSPDWLH